MLNAFLECAFVDQPPSKTDISEIFCDERLTIHDYYGPGGEGNGACTAENGCAMVCTRSQESNDSQRRRLCIENESKEDTCVIFAGAYVDFTTSGHNDIAIVLTKTVGAQATSGIRVAKRIVKAGITAYYDAIVDAPLYCTILSLSCMGHYAIHLANVPLHTFHTYLGEPLIDIEIQAVASATKPQPSTWALRVLGLHSPIVHPIPQSRQQVPAARGLRRLPQPIHYNKSNDTEEAQRDSQASKDNGVSPMARRYQQLGDVTSPPHCSSKKLSLETLIENEDQFTDSRPPSLQLIDTPPPGARVAY